LSASPLWSYLASLPAGVVLFSNAADVIYVHTERTVPYVPRKYEMVSLRPNPEYEEEMRAMARRVQEGAVVVYFPDVRRHFIPDVQEFESLTGLKARPIGDNAVVFTNTKIGDHP
jgi:hypothetical protein